MDAQQFDILTRSLVLPSSRRWILAGLASALSGIVPVTLTETVSAKKKHKHRRKRKRRRKSTTTPPETCPAGQVDCDGRCGLPELAECDLAAECCSNRCYFSLCRPCGGMFCESEADCCAGLACEGQRCGGCVAEGSACQTDEDCCYSACNAGKCLSLVGQPCATGIDCKDCYGSPEDLASGCVGLCMAGRCQCPTECCADTDCAPAEHCVDGECQANAGG